jgi:hypothetical protein
LLAELLEAAYFTIEFQAFMLRQNLQAAGYRNRLKRTIRAFKTDDEKQRDNRVLLICRPYRGENRCFWYRPPFGLHHYDTRWIDGAREARD